MFSKGHWAFAMPMRHVQKNRKLKSLFFFISFVVGVCNEMCNGGAYFDVIEDQHCSYSRILNEYLKTSSVVTSDKCQIGAFCKSVLSESGHSAKIISATIGLLATSSFLFLFLSFLVSVEKHRIIVLSHSLTHVSVEKVESHICRSA